MEKEEIEYDVVKVACDQIKEDIKKEKLTKINEQLAKLFPEWSDVTVGYNCDNKLMFEAELDDAQYFNIPFEMFETAKRLLKEFDFDIK